MGQGVTPSGIHSEHNEVSVRCADFLSRQDRDVLRSLIESRRIESDVVLGDGDEVEIRIASGLDNTLERSTAVVTNARVHVQDPYHFTRSTAAQVVQWEMSEIAVEQNRKPED